MDDSKIMRIQIEGERILQRRPELILRFVEYVVTGIKPTYVLKLREMEWGPIAKYRSEGEKTLGNSSKRPNNHDPKCIS